MRSVVSPKNGHRSLKKLCVLLLGILAAGGCTREHEQLLLDAESERAEVRARAIGLIAKDPWPNDDAVLFKAIGDSSWAVRLEAAKALYLKKEDQRVPAVLRSLLEDPVVEVQSYGVKGLLNDPTPANVAYVRNAFMHKGRETRTMIAGEASAEMLAEFVQREAAERWGKVVEELSVPAPARQAVAARILGESGRIQEAEPILTGLLKDPSPYVVAGALEGLAALGTGISGASKDLVLELLEDATPIVRVQAIRTAAALELSAAVPAIRELAEGEGEAQLEAIRALGVLSAQTTSRQAASSALCALLDASTPSTADVVAETIRRNEISCDLTSVGKDLETGGAVALSALTSLTRLPAPGLAGKILPLLDAEEPEIRAQAWRALSQLTDLPQVREVLEKRLNERFASYDGLMASWLPMELVRGQWPESRFQSPAHDHSHGHDDHDDAPIQELSDKDVENLVNDRSATLTFEQKKGGIQKLIGRLDKIARDRTEAMGLKTADLKTLFAYRDNFIPDLPLDEDTVLEGQLLALTRLPGIQLTDKTMETLWLMPGTRERACEIAGVRANLAGENSADGAAAQDERKPKGDAVGADEILRRCLRDRIREHQEAALRGLVRQGPQAAHVIAEALAERTEQRAPLIRALMALDAERESLPIIRTLLLEGGEDGAAAIEAAAAMSDTGAVPILLQKLRDPALRERSQVLTALGKIGSAGDAAVDEALFRDLFSDKRSVRSAALKALADRGAANANVKAAALRHDYFADVRALAVKLFGEAPAQERPAPREAPAKAASPAPAAPAEEAQEK